MSRPAPSSTVSQAAFIAAALDPDAAVPAGLTDHAGAPTKKRFDVYRNNIVVGLIDALGAGFPAVKSLVGDEFFAAMAGEYVRKSPPQSPLMPEYGAEFPAFIAGFPPAGSLPYLADVATLEFAMRRAYHAADCTPVSASDLADPTLFLKRLTLAPAVQMVRSAYPVAEIRVAALGGPQPTSGAQDVLVTRAEFDPVATGFPAGTAAVITAISNGIPLGEAVEAAPDALDLTAFISALVSGGAIYSMEDIS